MFAALGRFSVRHRYLIILGWLAAAVVAATLLPSISSVERGANSQFLPATAPSVQASDLAAPFQSTTKSQSTFVAATTDRRPLSAADDAAIVRAEDAMRRVPKVTGLVDLGPSPNGRARTALVQVDVRTSGGGKEVAAAVSELRAAFARAGAPAGLAMHLTGPLAQSADEQNQTNHIQTLTEVLSILFIVILLLITFRALLAPFIALLPSAVALIVAGPVVALSTHIGVQVSDLTPILLIVVMLGAGTDYGLFLIFRLREELRRGRTIHDGVAVALCKVGESITFSGVTVMAALAAVVVASFGLYQGLGPALAIGIAVALAANLTLLPALLTVFGRATFWPRMPVPGPVRHGAWGRIAARVVARPAAHPDRRPGHLRRARPGHARAMSRPASATSRRRPTPTRPGARPCWSPTTPRRSRTRRRCSSGCPPRCGTDPAVLEEAQQSCSSAPGTSGRSTGRSTRTGSRRRRRRWPPPMPHCTVAVRRRPCRSNRRPAPASRLPTTTPTGTPPSRSAPTGGPSSSRPSWRPVGRTSPAAAAAIPAVRAAVAGVARSIGATASGINGYAATAADVSKISTDDLVRIIPIVLLVLALLLAILLRSLVAPLYLVASVGLSYLASLGLCVLAFEIIGHQNGINFVLPFFMFIFIMALGQDYNILVMTRIREEAHHAGIRVAVRRAVEATGTTVTSAGLILAGTFGVLTATGNTQVQEIGLGLAAGILLDTFFVRTLLVPSVVVLLGRWNWWPSALARAGDGTIGGEAGAGHPLPVPDGLVIPGGGATALSPAASTEALTR